MGVKTGANAAFFLPEVTLTGEVAIDGARLVALDADMTAARGEIDRLYARWAELEAKTGT